MNLQYFAEQDQEDNSANQETNNEEDDSQEEQQENNQENNLPQTQSELDSLINKANQRAIENAKKDMYSKDDVQQMIDEAIQNQKDYEGLSEEDKDKKKLEDDRKKLEQDRQAFEKERLTAQIKADLADKGLPTVVDIDGEDYDFAQLFAGVKDNQEAFNSVSAFHKAFNEAVAKQRKEGMKQRTPGLPTKNNQTTESLGAQLAKQSISGQPIFKEEN